MCGISGIINFSTPLNEYLHCVNSSLNHRGPDNSGVWFDENLNIGVAHTRLSILDLSDSGSQPMTSSNNRYIISFNGEIYNHLELRKKIEIDHKIIWKSLSDTETILTCVSYWGIENTLKKLIGMFALAIVDLSERKLFLVRDRMGEKPMFFGKIDNKFFFASELKAFDCLKEVKKEIDKNALTSFMRFGYIPSPKTIYQNIYKLSPGSILELKISKVIDYKIKSYWSPIDEHGNVDKTNLYNSEEAILNNYEKLLTDSIKRQQLSDVPIGSFLSGGVDSSLTTSIMQSLSNDPINTFTIGFTELDYDESIKARKIANHLGTNHNEHVVTSSELLDVVPRMTEIYDEPFADPSQIPTYLISKFAKNKVTVCLSGDGGDEIFAGYNRYVWLNRIENIPRKLKKIISLIINLIGSHRINLFLKLFFSLLPDKGRFTSMRDKIDKINNILQFDNKSEIYLGIISNYNYPEKIIINGHDTNNILFLWNSISDCNDIEKMMLIDILSFLCDDVLCKVDRASMSNSLEVRSPFLDHELVKYSFKIPLNFKLKNNESKYLTKKLLSKYLPKDLYEYPKMGFTIPLNDWLNDQLKEWAEDSLSSIALDDQYLNREHTEILWANFKKGNSFYQNIIWNILSFQSWRKKLV